MACPSRSPRSDGAEPHIRATAERRKVWPRILSPTQTHTTTPLSEVKGGGQAQVLVSLDPFDLALFKVERRASLPKEGVLDFTPSAERG